MKRLLSLLVIGFLLVCLVGCGSSSTEETTTEDTEVEDTAASLDEDIIGTWQETVGEEVADVDNTVEASEVDSYTFDADGKVLQELYLSAANNPENTELSNVEGTYTIKDDQVTIEIETINGQTKDELTADPGDLTTEEIDALYESVTYTAVIEDDTLILENNDITLELTKIK